MTTDDISIVPLSENRLPDLRRLFDEGGDPKTCQCAFWRVPASGWGNWTREHNRAALEPVAGREPAPGLVAYADGAAVGWVSIGPREDYVRLERSKVLTRLDDRPVWSIVCFVVSRRWRGRGLAAALLDAAIEHARGNGATLVEAYPVDPSRGRVSAAAAYMGPLGMFERAGFSVAARQQWNAKSPVRPIVRLELPGQSVVQPPIDSPDEHPDNRIQPDKHEGDEAKAEAEGQHWRDIECDPDEHGDGHYRQGGGDALQ